MTARHNALLGALSRFSHLGEFTEPLNDRGNWTSAADRQTAARTNIAAASASDLTALDARTSQYAAVTNPAGAGITDGVGTVVSVERETIGHKVITRYFIDLTGLASSTTDLDIIGVGTNPAYLAKIVAAFGTPCAGRVICLETPAGGADDIDFYVADEGTGKFDDGIAALTETALITSGAAWAVGVQKNFAAGIATDKYLYATGGEAGTAATYTAGRFMIEIEGSTFTGT